MYEAFNPIIDHLAKRLSRCQGWSDDAILLRFGVDEDYSEVTIGQAKAFVEAATDTPGLAEAIFVTAERTEQCALTIAQILGVRLERASPPFNQVVTELAMLCEAANITYQARYEREKQRHAGTIEELKAEQERSKKLRDELNANHEVLQQNNFWRWQGDGTDEPESLVCQVVMTAQQLRGLLAKAEQLTDVIIERDRAQHDLSNAEADANDLRTVIAAHHAARGHDRCWENDAALYRAAGLDPGEPQLPPRPEFRQRCQEYEAGQYGDVGQDDLEAKAN